MIKPGDVLSYAEMCVAENVSLQRGMNFRLNGNSSVILMSRRTGAPYSDRVEDEGRVLIYEGHDVPRTRQGPNPKRVNQQLSFPSGKPTQNGFFFQAAESFKSGDHGPERVRVYEKIREGIWTFNGVFELIDAWRETAGKRDVFKFKLRITEDDLFELAESSVVVRDDDRIIPSSVKLQVWKRDRGQCAKCGCKDRLHFDHIIPYSKGGSSKDARNIQLLCARHNLQKRDNIE